MKRIFISKKEAEKIVEQTIEKSNDLHKIGLIPAISFYDLLPKDENEVD